MNLHTATKPPLDLVRMARWFEVNHAIGANEITIRINDTFLEYNWSGPGNPFANSNRWHQWRTIADGITEWRRSPRYREDLAPPPE